MTDIIILAAGKGTRMNSNLPKVLVPLQERPMIHYLLDSIVKSNINTKPIIVVSPDNHEQMQEALKEYDVRFVVQDRQLGTGHAVFSAKDESSADKTLVLYGDHPFLSSESINNFVSKDVEALNLMSVKVDDFSAWKKAFYHWGRLFRDENNKLEKIVEFKDASESEKEITEVNPAMFIFNSSWLWENISNLDNKNKQEEYYLTDLVSSAFKQGTEIKTIQIDAKEAIGINSLEELEIAEKLILDT
ncbi:MAG TPA: NTP transferase domain-containing protein [Patescibacteria group bacterium]|nr:NTP transferase domain-containing protein [Patescibacteria group bacterium]